MVKRKGMGQLKPNANVERQGKAGEFFPVNSNGLLGEP